jgi:tRNA (mo5U34)-methyltransferase
MTEEQVTLQSSGGAAGDAEVARLGPWFHNLHLPDGTQTAPDHPLGDFPRFKWEQLAGFLADDLRGLTVLDIGCNAGFYSFALARRGAAVLGIDHDPHYLRQARWAAEKLGLSDSVRFEHRTVYDLRRFRDHFDVILFMGVMYHLRYPLLALDLVANRLGGLLVFQTLTMPGQQKIEPLPDISLEQRDQLLEPGWPLMAFVEHRMAGDPTNWWLANEAAVEAMLRSAGLRVTGRPGHEIWLAERDRAFQHGAELRAVTGGTRDR